MMRTTTKPHAPEARSLTLVTLLSVAERARSIWSDQLAATIRAERSAAGLTQSDMVARSGISRSTYLRLERGTRVADITQIGLICQALKLSLSTFMHRVDERVRDTK